MSFKQEWAGLVSKARAQHTTSTRLNGAGGDGPDATDGKRLHVTAHVLRSHASRADKVSDEFQKTHDLKTALQIAPPGKGFNDDIAGHLKDVETEAKEDVDTLMKLAGTEGFKNDPKLLARFNGLLAKNARNSCFAEEFATRMGPKWVEDFWYRTAKPEYDGESPAARLKERPEAVTKQLAALQDNLGVTLGLASRSDSPGMAQWKQEALASGDERVPLGRNQFSQGGQKHLADPPYRFQVLSNLMRTGKWETGFLDRYGDTLVEFDKKPYMPWNGTVELDEQTHRKWLSFGNQRPDFLNFGEEYDKGEDPFTGYFEALGHNSDASTDFFKDDENFDHVLRERTWLPDGEAPGSGREKGFTGPRVALGHALASATTGHDWDAPLNVPAEHTADQATLMSKIIKGTGAMDEDGNADLSLAPGMRPGLGNAAAEYAPDFFRAMTEGDGDDKLFPLSGAQAGMEHRDATKFLVQLGQDPDAHAVITAGQKLYTAQVLDHHLGGDVPAGQRYAHPRGTPWARYSRPRGRPRARWPPVPRRPSSARRSWRIRSTTGPRCTTVCGATAPSAP